jgi:rod shape-determining protein MreC
MLKRQHYTVLALVVLATLILLNLRNQTTAHLKLGIGGLFFPLFGLAGSAQQLAGKVTDALLPRSELLKQIEALRHENQQLRLEATQTQEMRRENDRLRKLFGWQQQKPWKLKLASVILREPSNWWRTVQIDLGERDQIKVNMPVLTAEGLVGRVSSVSLTHSTVLLLGDPNCRVAARVENENRDSGVIGTSGPLETEFVEMAFLSRNANLKPGQNVKTSGEGGVFPKDILIGKVVDTRPVEYGLSSAARVRLAANLNALEEVWVLFP